MPTLTTFLIAGLATYYAALSVAQQEGPFGAFEWLRNRFVENDWKGRGIRCVICVSCWVALVVVVGLVLLGDTDVWASPTVWLGLAGASVVIDRYWKR